jgi:hypothetical protein
MRPPRFKISHLLLVTTLIAIFCVVLVKENEWLRAAYVTCALAALLNAANAAIFARGERQAYATGFMVGSGLFAVFGYAAPLTLPYLLTVRLYDWMKAASVAPDDEHYWIVTITGWAFLTAMSSGMIARGWYRHVQAKKTDNATLGCPSSEARLADDDRGKPS